MAALAVALLALGLAMALPSSDGLSREVESAEARLRLEKAAVTAESRVAFLLLTEPAGRFGLEIGGPHLAADGSLVSADPAVQRRPLLFDGRPYRFALEDGSEAIIRIQDSAGLINVAEGNRALLTSLMQTCGLTPPRALAVADAMAFARPAPPVKAASFDAAPPPSLRWESHVRGSMKRRLQTASTYLPGESGLNIATASPSVLMALYRGDRATVAALLRARAAMNKTTKVSIKYNQNEYISNIPVVKRQTMGNKLVITVEFVSPKLTRDLPLYFYRTNLKADDLGHLHAFSAEGSFVDVGRHSECYPHLDTAAELFPES